MLWCGLDLPGGMDPAGRNRLGTGLGVTALGVDGNVDAADLATVTHLGARLARVSARRMT
jgi:hypothetical protein